MLTINVHISKLPWGLRKKTQQTAWHTSDSVTTQNAAHRPSRESGQLQTTCRRVFSTVSFTHLTFNRDGPICLGSATQTGHKTEQQRVKKDAAGSPGHSSTSVFSGHSSKIDTCTMSKADFYTTTTRNFIYLQAS